MWLEKKCFKFHYFLFYWNVKAIVCYDNIPLYRYFPKGLMQYIYHSTRDFTGNREILFL